MKRRSKSGGSAANARKSKSAKPARRSAKKPNAGRTLSKDRPDQVVRLERELKEVLERQTATSEVLHAISSAAGELEPVFQALLRNAVQICQASLGNLWL